MVEHLIDPLPGDAAGLQAIDILASFYRDQAFVQTNEPAPVSFAQVRGGLLTMGLGE